MNYHEILSSISENYSDILQKNLTGIYVHGSIAFGCFNWDKSDIDFIVVVNEELSHETKRKLMDFTVKLNEQAPPKGLEMSIVLKKYCGKFQYPTSFELHFSNTHKEWYHRNPDDYCEHMHGEDKDLAAHFTIIKHAGIVLCGEPISGVFGDVPSDFYLDSIKEDILNAKEDINQNPVYIVLNLCRVAAYIKKGLILSKKQGGEWGSENLDSDYQPIIISALHSYQTNKTMNIEKDKSSDFCDYMLSIIFSTER